MDVRPFRYVTVVAIALLVHGMLRVAKAEDCFVVPNSYIIQRNASYVGSLSEDQVRYTIVQPSEFFDVVTPARYAERMTSASHRGREVLDPRKVEADCAEILKDPTVATCDPNRWLRAFAVPNDPSFNLQWYHQDPSSRGGDTKVPTAWELGTGGSNTLIGVIDSGIYTSHPDLSPNLWVNPSDPVDGLDNDGNGYVDDVSGVNTALNRSNPEDLDGHGTHVSGIIAARGNNGVGISGVMWQASIVTAAVATDASGEFSDEAVFKAYNYMYKLKRDGHKIRVINASFGGDYFSKAEYDAIALLRSVDVLLVAAAGNDARSLDTTKQYPASYDLDNIITVAATGPTARISYYSNYGQSVDIAAPGGDTRAGGKMYSTYSPNVPEGAMYAYQQGTSMAAPVVTGAIGLLASQRPTLSGSELKELLLSKADPLSHLTSYVKDGRFLNIGAAATSGVVDFCPNDPDKTEAGVCGCGIADTDGDSDGTPDCNDGCALDGQKKRPGACGCGIADTDSDADGTADCIDGCASDAQKKSAGACGCGVPDTDADGDNSADCVDGCVSDGEKATPGICGCGVSDADADGNGTPDCKDPQLAGLVPPTPTLKSAKGKVTITMSPKNGVKYFLKVVVQDPKGKKVTPKPKTSYYSSDGPSITIAKLKSKAKLTVSYAYYYGVAKTVSSSYSAVKSIGVK